MIDAVTHPALRSWRLARDKNLRGSRRDDERAGVHFAKSPFLKAAYPKHDSDDHLPINFDNNKSVNFEKKLEGARDLPGVFVGAILTR